MSYRTLVWMPILVATPLLFAELALEGHPQTLAIGVEVELAKMLWLAGALAAARSFDPGDYLRRGWLFIAAASALFLARDATLLLPVVEATAPATTLGIV